MDCGAVSVEDMAEDPLKVVPSSVSVPLPVALKPTASGENAIENQAASMANRSCSPPLLSPAEASPAKPATTMPTLTNGDVIDTSPTTMDIASASDSLASVEMNRLHAEAVPSPPQSTASENTEAPVAVPEDSLSSTLAFKGISVTLDNDRIWQEFYRCGTEMIVTKQGRRMFPCCRYRLSGLEPLRHYSLVLSISPVDAFRHRFTGKKWETGGLAENHGNNSVVRAFAHHNSPCSGVQWMSLGVSFHKLKLTNSASDADAGHIILNSMQRYIPRLHVIPVPDGTDPCTAGQPVIQGPESLTFTFPQTEFYSVTTYQNLRITQLKISHNPFAKGFREAMQSFGLSRPTPEALPLGRDDDQSLDLTTFRPGAGSTEQHGVQMKRAGSASFSAEEEEEAETQAKKRRVSEGSDPDIDVDHSDDDDCLQSLRAQLASVPEQHSPDPPLSSTPHRPFSLEPVQCGGPLLFEVPKRRYTRIAPKPQQPASTPELSPESPERPKRRRRVYRRWGSYQGRGWGKARTGGVAKPAAPAASQLPAYPMQPELDDVEGLLFVSFTSKEALGIHVGSMTTSSSLPVSPVSLTPQRTGSDEEKISRLQEALVRDLRLLKHRQVIHPVLQEVGLKLSSLDPTRDIDLQYLGVRLPLPPPVLSEQPGTTDPAPNAGGLSFVSRTGKTSDLTKIKGWRDKFIKRNESSALKCDRSQKDLSAFCSNMLDEYLESEAQQISERAAAFNTNAEDSPVSYRLPSSSTSYVKTLDSVLKHQNAAAQKPKESATQKPKVWWPRSIRPCPLSFKPLLYSALVSPAQTKHRAIAPKPAWVSAVSETTTPVQKPAATTKRGRRPKVIQEASPPSQSCPPGSSQKPVQDRSHPVTSPVTSPKPVQSLWSSAGYILGPTPFRPLKAQVKLLEMETGAFNQGLRRTHLTPQRVSIALSVLLTAQMDHYQKEDVPEYQKPSGPECGQEFCRLGCVCSSLRRESRGPLHCRRPDCMFGCACFKGKFIKRVSEEEEEDEDVYMVRNMDDRPNPGSHSEVLWDHQRSAEDDPEPIFSPKCYIDPPLRPVPVIKRYVPRLSDPIREEDKDPVYKYFERMMTCARVREFTNKPPAEPSPAESPQPNTPACPVPPSSKNVPTQNVASQNVPMQNVPTTVLKMKTAGKETLPKDSTKGPPKIKRLLEVQSKCQWSADRQVVLRDLCTRMTQNNFPPEFAFGPYRIRLMEKIVKRNHSWTTMTYKVRISKPKKKKVERVEVTKEAEAEPVEAEEWGWDEATDNNSSEEEREPVEEEMPPVKPEVRVGVTPFLSGVLPAGHLKAKKRRAGKEPVGLVKVNHKSYNQARLLLGVMGSLHPANRLAAYVTGRLRTAAKPPSKNSQKQQEADPGKKPASCPKPESKLSKKPTVGPKPQPDLSKKPAVCPKAQSDLLRKMPAICPRPPQSCFGIRPAICRKMQSYLAKNQAICPKPPQKTPTSLVGLSRFVKLTGQVAPPLPPPPPPQEEAVKSKLNRGPRGPYKVNKPGPTPTPMVTFISNRHGALMPSGNNASSSPISLTVSPSLKSPSFLGQSGTYSFRICPPPADQSQASSSPSQGGVTLPGGFTLIQLPKPGDVQRAQQELAANPKATAAAKVQQVASDSAAKPHVDNKPGLVSDGVRIQILENVRSAEAGSSSSPQLKCEETMPSDESDEAEKDKGNKAMKEMDNVERDRWNRQVKTDPAVEKDNWNAGVKREPDDASQNVSSDSSDYECNDDSIDIETVEGTEQIISEMRASARRILSRDSGEDSCSSNGQRNNKVWDRSGISGSPFSYPTQAYDGEEIHKRNCHNLIERRRRSEHKHLFSKLQNILHSDPRVPKLHLLSQALTEIRSLVEKSKSLEENKRVLTEMQSIYIKELSRLSGKPEVLIKTKLKQIYEKKKLLDARRADSDLPQQPETSTHQPTPASEPQSSWSSESQPQPEVSTACPPGQVPAAQFQLKYQPQTAAAASLQGQSDVQRQAPKSVPCRTLVLVPAPKPNSEDKPSVSLSVASSVDKPSVSLSVASSVGKPSLSLRVASSVGKPSVSLSVASSVGKPSVSLSVASSVVKVVKPRVSSSCPSESAPQAAGKTFSLPLVRSKTGRIILPSSLRPASEGYYTLMLMGLNQNAEEREKERVEEREKALKAAREMALNDEKREKVLTASSNLVLNAEVRGKALNASINPVQNAEVQEKPLIASGNLVPSDLNSSADQEKTCSEQPSDSLEEEQNSDCTGQVEAENEVSNPQEETTATLPAKRPPHLTGPLVEIARLNKSIFSSTVTLQPVDKMMNGGRLVVSKMGQTASLCFSPDVSQSASLEKEPEVFIEVPEPTPPVARRGPGRPRKHASAAPVAVGGGPPIRVIRIIPNGGTRFTNIMNTQSKPTTDTQSTENQPGNTEEQPGSTADHPGSPAEQPGSTTEQTGSTTPDSTADQPGCTEEQPGGPEEDGLEKVSPAPVKRGVGRPRKRPRVESPNPVSPSRVTRSVDTPGRGRGTTPGRGRGRPGRGRGTPGRGRGTPVRQTESSPTKVGPVEQSPTRSTSHTKNTPVSEPKDSPAAVVPTRHMTRGALGKDFPSAKKRSWLDMEKELELGEA